MDHRRELRGQTRGSRPRTSRHARLARSTVARVPTAPLAAHLGSDHPARGTLERQPRIDPDGLPHQGFAVRLDDQATPTGASLDGGTNNAQCAPHRRSPAFGARGRAVSRTFFRTNHVLTRRNKKEDWPLQTDVARDVERAARKSGPRAADVVLARRDVVGRVRVEEGRERLDLWAPRTELELTAAVHRDAIRATVVDRIEQPLHGPEPRRLDIEEPRRALLDVGDGMNRRVPA